MTRTVIDTVINPPKREELLRRVGVLYDIPGGIVENIHYERRGARLTATVALPPAALPEEKVDLVGADVQRPWPLLRTTAEVQETVYLPNDQRAWLAHLLALRSTMHAAGMDVLGVLLPHGVQSAELFSCDLSTALRMEVFPDAGGPAATVLLAVGPSGKPVTYASMLYPVCVDLDGSEVFDG